MDRKQLTALFDAEVDKNWQEFVALSDDLAAHPEVSGEEYETSRKIEAILKKKGFEVELPFLDIPTAFMAKKGTLDAKARVALMVEYDALPEIGHACGHNLHGAMSLLAGVSLLPFLDGLDAQLMVVGTPAEETSGAKVVMAERGVFDGVDLAIMIHCSGGSSSAKYRSLAMDAVEFTFTGQTAHAASAPWEGRNALNGLQLFFHALDMLRQHIKPDARIHGIYSVGGAAPNIVPEKAAGRFYFRAPKRNYLDKMMEQVLNCARGAVLATDTEVSWRPFEASFKDVLPAPTGEALLAGIFEALGVPVVEEEGFQGSSDVGDVSYRCPAMQPKLDLSNGRVIEAHTRAFAAATTAPEGHEALRTGAKVLGHAAIAVFLDDALRERLNRDFEKELGRG